MKVTFAREALHELKEAGLYLEEQRPGLGDEFAKYIGQAVELVRASPLAWRPLGADFRRYRIDRFRYSLIYRYSNDELLIVAVAHDRQRPGYWVHRSD